MGFLRGSFSKTFGVLFALIYGVAWFIPSEIQAQAISSFVDSKKDYQRGSLSQLQFDISGSKHDRSEESLRKGVELLEDLLEADVEPVEVKKKPVARAKSSTKSNVHSPKKVKKAKKAKKALGSSAAKQHSVMLLPSEGASPQGYTFLIPRLKGPSTDKGANTLITSRHSWKRQKNRACHELSRSKGLADKSIALKEVLNRFSGSDDFYSSLNKAVCTQSCVSGQHPKIVGLAVVETHGGDFSIVREGASCRYRIAKPKEHGWKMLQGRRAVCACLASAK